MVKRLLFILLVTISTYSNGQVSEWLIPIDSSFYVTDVAMDNFGNAFICGFSNTTGVSLNGTYYRSGNLPPNDYRAYLAKVDSLGNALWIKQMSSRWGSDILITAIHIDRTNDVIVEVYFNDTLLIENDTSIFLPSYTPNAIYRHAVVKFDNNGTFKWATVIPGSSTFSFQYNVSIMTDDQKCIYINHDTVYYAQNTYHGFILKLDHGGNIIDSFPKEGNSIGFCIDQKKNVWVPWSSYFNGHQFSDTLIVRYDSLGSVNYQLTGSGKIQFWDLEVDTSGNLYALGRFHDMSGASIGGYTINTNSALRSNDFIIKVNKFGVVLWMKQLNYCGFGPPFYGYTYIDEIALDRYGDLLLQGNYSQIACMFGDSLRSPIYNDSGSVVIYKLDGNGDLIWSKHAYGANYQRGTSIVTGFKDNIYVTISANMLPSDTFIVDHIPMTTNYGGFLWRIKDASNLASGYVYIDSNNNSIPNTGDRFIESQLIAINGVNHYYTFTDHNGFYDAYLMNGSYSLEYNHPIKHHFSSPTTHPLSFSGSSQVDDDNHFKLTAIPGVNDMRVQLIPLGASRSWWSDWAYVVADFRNVGTTYISDTCVLNFDPRLELTYASIPPTDTMAGKLSWIFSNMAPYSRNEAFLFFSFNKSIPNVSISDTLRFYAGIYLNGSDTFPIDNVDSTLNVVRGSHDPNDKVVQPMGKVRPAFVQEGNYLYYTIRFQNTGTAAANFVRIRDALSEDLLIESFEMLSSSHDYRLEFINPDMVDFIFENINLPDSGTNFEQSMGYVSFRIKAVPTLEHGDVVENCAAIYFDNNQAVITNTTYTEIYEYLGLKETKNSENGLKLFPNPNRGSFRILLPSEHDSFARVRILDLSGRTVTGFNNVPLQEHTILIDGLALKNGMYLLQVMIDQEVYQSKMIISNE